MADTGTGMRAQSAMEYLINYSWALLILAVIFAALFALGVFGNPNPQFAQPGGCRVERVNGPGSTPQGLGGTCIGQLPLSVAKLDGLSSYAVLPAQNYSSTMDEQSIGVWVYLNVMPIGANVMPVLYQHSQIPTGPNQYATVGSEIYVDSNGNVIYKVSGSCGLVSCLHPSIPAVQVNGAVQANEWYYIFTTAATFVPGVTNSVSVCVTSSASSVSCNSMTQVPLQAGGVQNGYYTIGTDLGKSYSCTGYCYFDGYISNLQIYDTVLSEADANSLYLEGIGGAPIDINHLIGWWPLNGNANDYSGNEYSNTIAATSGNFVFSSVWYQTTKYKNP